MCSWFPLLASHFFLKNEIWQFPPQPFLFPFCSGGFPVTILQHSGPNYSKHFDIYIGRIFQLLKQEVLFYHGKMYLASNLPFYHCKVYSLRAGMLSTFVLLCRKHHPLAPELFIIPDRNSVPTTPPAHPPTLETTILLCISMHSTTLSTSPKWNHTFVLLHLAYFT